MTIIPSALRRGVWLVRSVNFAVLFSGTYEACQKFCEGK